MATNITPSRQSKNRVSRNPADAPIHALYAGGPDRIGEILCRDGKYLAFDRRGNPLGSHDTPLEAAAAIGEALARGGPP
jgi:hypothetical protein